MATRREDLERIRRRLRLAEDERTPQEELAPLAAPPRRLTGQRLQPVAPGDIEQAPRLQAPPPPRRRQPTPAQAQLSPGARAERVEELRGQLTERREEREFAESGAAKGRFGTGLAALSNAFVETFAAAGPEGIAGLVEASATEFAVRAFGDVDNRFTSEQAQRELSEGSPLRAFSEVIRNNTELALNPEFADLVDPETDAIDVANLLTTGIPQGLGSMGGFLLGTLLSGGSNIAVAVLGGFVNVSEVDRMAVEANAPADKRLAADLIGFGVGLSEAASLARMLRRMRIGSSLAKAMVLGAFEEGAQEAFQGVANNAIAAGILGLEQDLIDGGAKAGTIIGGVTGAIVSTALAALGGRRGRRPAGGAERAEAAASGKPIPPDANEPPPGAGPTPVQPVAAGRPEEEAVPIEGVLGAEPEPAGAEPATPTIVPEEFRPVVGERGAFLDEAGATVEGEVVSIENEVAQVDPGDGQLVTQFIDRIIGAPEGTEGDFPTRLAAVTAEAEAALPPVQPDEEQVNLPLETPELELAQRDLTDFLEGLAPEADVSPGSPIETTIQQLRQSIVDLGGETSLPVDILAPPVAEPVVEPAAPPRVTPQVPAIEGTTPLGLPEAEDAASGIVAGVRDVISRLGKAEGTAEDIAAARTAIDELNLISDATTDDAAFDRIHELSMEIATPLVVQLRADTAKAKEGAPDVEPEPERPPPTEPTGLAETEREPGIEGQPPAAIPEPGAGVGPPGGPEPGQPGVTGPEAGEPAPPVEPGAATIPEIPEAFTLTPELEERRQSVVANFIAGQGPLAEGAVVESFGEAIAEDATLSDVTTATRATGQRITNETMSFDFPNGARITVPVLDGDEAITRRSAERIFETEIAVRDPRLLERAETAQGLVGPTGAAPAAVGAAQVATQQAHDTLRESGFEDKAAFAALQRAQGPLGPQARELAKQFLRGFNPTEASDQRIRDSTNEELRDRLGSQGVHSSGSGVEIGTGFTVPVQLKRSKGQVGVSQIGGVDVGFNFNVNTLLNEIRVELGDGIQAPIPPGDEGAGAGAVQGTAEGGPAPEARPGKEPRGPQTTGRPDGGRAEGPRGGLPEREQAPSVGGTGAGATDRVPTGRPGTRGSIRQDADAVKGTNYQIAPGALEELRGPVQKARDNIAVIRLMREIAAEDRAATHAEQEILARYVGWGPVKEVFPDSQGEFGPGGFGEVGAQLRELLNDTDYAIARRTQQYAHYTSETVTRAMWDIAQRLGFNGGKVFEPGMGVGNFAGFMPADLAGRTDYNGLELDPTTTDIARLLYPHAGVRLDDMTTAPVPENTYDLVIGNPPFADLVVRSDPKYPQKFLLHDYFFAKSLDSVRPGGILMFVTSAGTMNKLDTKARAYLADRADLVGAIRLPNSAFQQSANTKVTTDIIILRKRLPDEPAGDRSWVETERVTLKGRLGENVTGSVSSYFVKHPEQVLGEEGFFDPLFPKRYGVNPNPGQDLAADLGGALERLPQNVLSELETPTEHADLDFTSTERKDDSFYIKDGELWQQREGVGRPHLKRGKGIRGGLTKGGVERIRGLIPIRDALRDVYAADLNDDVENADKARKRLNQTYDAFVKKFGPINKAKFRMQRPSIVQQESARQEAREDARLRGEGFKEGEFKSAKLIRDGATLATVARMRKEARAVAQAAGREFDEGTFDPADMPDIVIETLLNVKEFMIDPESYRLRAIEEYNDETEEAAKGGVFTENVITRERPPQINSIGDAVLFILNKEGRFNLDEAAGAAEMPRDQAIAELGDSIFQDPAAGKEWVLREDYLSGNVKQKLALAREATLSDPTMRRNVEALEAVQPTPLSPGEIEVQLGTPWVPAATMQLFGTEKLGLNKLEANYHPKAGWRITGDTSSAAATVDFGTPDLNAPQLLGIALNRQEPKVFRTVRIDGIDRRQLDVEATEAAIDKMKDIKAAFADWIWSDTKRADELAEFYNENFNNLVTRPYDGSYLQMPGVASGWQWREHQTRVMARIIQSGNTYMAHAVGSGKTAAMIGAGMEMRRLGLVRKPMYVVPNNMLAQFTREFYELYPTARISVADEARFHKGRRKQFVANAAQQDLDAVIITHTAFAKIPISSGFMSEFIQEQIEELREILRDVGAVDNISRRRIENQIERLVQKLTAARKTDQVFTFEETGVDFLFIDEAHTFRKLDIATRMGGLKGIDPEGADRSRDLFVKTRYLQTVNPDRNLVLASGTPVTNTMAELYSLSKYIDPSGLEERGLSHFDAWAGAFGTTNVETEQDPAGGYKQVSRFAQFVNAVELSNIVRQTMDVVTPTELAEFVVLPEIRGGKRKLHLAERSERLVAFQEQLRQRMIAIQRRGGRAQPGEDILLSVIGDGRKAAIDIRLVMRVAEDEESKLNILVDEVFNEWEATKNQPFYEVTESGFKKKPFARGPATQLIFAGLGLNVSTKTRIPFTVPRYIRNELMRRGVPREEIAFFADAKNSRQKAVMLNDFNEGKIRIMIGSPKRMGIGLNVQRRISAMHNLDPQWFPADDEQRIGRGLRQGNWNREIAINDYSTKGTYDSQMWQLMERKARFIEAFFRGDPTQRVLTDLGEASQFAQAKAMTTADPRMIELTNMQAELEKAERRRVAFFREKSQIRERIASARFNIEFEQESVVGFEADIARRQDISGDKFEAKMGDTTTNSREAFGKFLRDAVAAMLSSGIDGRATKGRKLGSISGFDITADVYPKFESAALYLETTRGQRQIRGDSELGLVRSIENRLRGLETDIVLAQQAIKANQAKVADFSSKQDKVFEGDEELSRLRKEVAELERILTAKNEEGLPTPENELANKPTPDLDAQLKALETEGELRFPIGQRVIINVGEAPLLGGLRDGMVGTVIEAGVAEVNGEQVEQPLVKFDEIEEPLRMGGEIQPVVGGVGGTAQPIDEQALSEWLNEGGALLEGDADLLREGPAPYNERIDSNPDTRQMAAELLKESGARALEDTQLGVKTLATAINAALIKDQTVNLVGLTIRTPHDLATMAQVYRDPRYETLRYFYTDATGKVVAQTGVSARMPGVTGAFPSGKGFEWVIDQVKRVGATNLWMVHNHPSGNSRPSDPDVDLTRQMRFRLRQAGLDTDVKHVIIDSNEYSTIETNIDELLAESSIPSRRANAVFPTTRTTKHHFGEDKLMQAALPSPLLGKLVNRPDQAAEVAAAVHHGAGWLTIVGVSGRRGGVRAIGEIHESAVEDRKGFNAALRQFAQSTGSQSLFIAGAREGLATSRKPFSIAGGVAVQPFGTRVQKWAERLITEGFVRDVITSDGVSVRHLDPELKPPRDIVLGAHITDASAQVREEGGDYDSDATKAQEETVKEVRKGTSGGGQPLDRMMRLPFKMLGLLNDENEFKPGVAAWERLNTFIKDTRFDETGPFAWTNRYLDHARHGMIDRYGLDKAFIERQGRVPAEIRQTLRQGQGLLERLMEAGVNSVEEGVVLGKMLTGVDLDGNPLVITDKEWSSLALEVRQAIDELGMEAVRLGQIPRESYERNRGTYLHRVYVQYEAISDENTLSRWLGRAMAGKRHGILASALRGRGIFSEITQERLLQDVTSIDTEAFFGVKKVPGKPDPVLLTKKFRILDKVEQIGGKVGTLEGIPEGSNPTKLKQRVYWPVEKKLPKGFGGFEDRGVWEVRRIKGGKLVLWRDFTQAERLQMGEILDARYTIARTYHHLANNLANGRFYEDISKNPEWTWNQKQPPPEETIANKNSALRHYIGYEWVLVPTETVAPKVAAKKWGALAGKYVRAEIWKDINELDSMNQAGPWQSLLRFWKKNKTARNPVVHANNVMSNLGLMDLIDVRARDLLRGFHSYVNQDENYQDAADHQAFGHSFVEQELKEQVMAPILRDMTKEAKQGLYEKGGYLGKIRFANQFARIASEAGSLLKRFDKAMTNGYMYEDEIFRLAIYVRKLEQGYSKSEAAAMARDQMLNYNIRAPWVNKARRSVLPFISYTYRAVPVITEALFRRPWKLAKYALLAEVANALAYAVTDDDEELERGSLRPEVRGDVWIAGVPRMMRAPFNDKHDNPIFLDIRRWIPAGDVFDLTQNQAMPIPAWLQFGGPIMIAGEMFLNKAAFTGDQIVNPLTDTLGDKAQKYGQFLYRSVAPSAPWIYDSWYWDKIAGALRGQRDVLNRPTSLPQAVASSVGFKFSSQDVQLNYTYRKREFDRTEGALRFVLKQAQRDLSRNIISQRAFSQIQTDTLEKLKRLEENRKETFAPLLRGAEQ